MGGFALGDAVRVRATRARGVVAYVGGLSGKDGIFYGVELQRGAPGGRNDGSCEGTRYFRCAPGQGVFVRETNLEGLGAARSHQRHELYEFADEMAGSKAAESKMLVSHEESKGASRSQGPAVGAGGAFRTCATDTNGWKRGPVRPEGVAMDVSDRPLLCAAISPDGQECVVGGTDHGLKIFSLVKGKMIRNLYSKTAGHAEWVTDVSYCPDGTILSAGMDAKLCLWRGPRCDDVLGHRGSISRALVTTTGTHALSCGYDKTLRIWTLRSQTEASCVRAHKAPILDMTLSKAGLVLTGARDGTATIWDLQGRAPAAIFQEDSHSGHVTSLHTWDNASFATGDQAGFVRLLDPRSRGNNESSHSMACLHAGGAVNAIRTSFESDILISAGADKRVVASDLRKLDRPLWVAEGQHTDFIYSLHVAGDLVLSGSGNGTLLFHEVRSGKLLYGLGANQAAIRTIDSHGNRLLVAGDDGNAIAYEFNSHSFEG
ncbi:Guanine nucleotide-binding protein subunit beta-2-like 1 [Hondaea fermentalgiana]|uniref:Guanine nucleotide-binding protein subunit beta-2-like 1 n=1 Tax=Hondaea fermentalgiana TaxID=2315210 RepID=A0A2R5G260_9STRA|nr:Guanine nucleotide-binding protein subunit beta-2-like 1 [Hondaea fermentalgiana]|eukprot:GBG25090.1 Guanine nucleotide-binding protein subunit beta-2-like 1 [Hondaea fermentalgiana]